jgi:hypothetical protein
MEKQLSFKQHCEANIHETLRETKNDLGLLMMQFKDEELK